MSRPAKRVVALLSVLLLGCLPLLAATLGYECRCTGRAVLVTVDHCDGPHGEWCLEAGMAHSDEPAHGHAGEGSPAGEDTEHHSVVQDDTDGLAPTVQTAPAVTTTLLAVLPDYEVWGSRLAGVRVAPKGGLFTSRPPPGAGVARTVVLLI